VERTPTAIRTAIEITRPFSLTFSKVWELAVEAPSAEGVNLGVELLANATDLVLGDALDAECFGEIVDRSRRDAMDSPSSAKALTSRVRSAQPPTSSSASTRRRTTSDFRLLWTAEG